MDRIMGFGPVDGGSIPPVLMNEVNGNRDEVYFSPVLMTRTSCSRMS